GVRACVEVDRDVDPAYGAAEEPGVNDGAFAHAFTVPEIVNGTVICARMTMAGDPTGPETSARWVSKQACFEGHPEQTEPPPPPTAGPVIPTTTTTTSAPAPASPTTTPPTTVPARQGETPRAAPPVTPRSNPTPAAPAQPGRVGDDTDDAPPLPVPVDLPELPRTGAGTTAGLVTAGLAALAGGALTRISVRRSRRR
ncbi:MAG: LPXTG cell wall anchor domain-containing protein, partial [Acidimicrobiia bacterium]